MAEASRDLNELAAAKRRGDGPATVAALKAAAGSLAALDELKAARDREFVSYSDQKRKSSAKELSLIAAGEKALETPQVAQLRSISATVLSSDRWQSAYSDFVSAQGAGRDFRKAVSLLEKAVATQPVFIEPRVSLAEIAVFQKRYDEGAAAALAALNLMGRKGRTAVLTAAQAAARAELAEALRLDPACNPAVALKKEMGL